MPIPEDSRAGPPDEATLPGRMLLGRFRVEKILGHGGMGEVLLAQDTLLHRLVALKRLRTGGTEEEQAARRDAILKEARRASQVSDRRIAAIYDVLELDHDVLIVMEYVDGSTLRARMAEPLPLGEFWNLATQCVEAVGAAHTHGVIHRDIKPENLMLTRDGQVKVLDFGIARRTEMQEGTPAAVTTVVTTTGDRATIIAGTPQYMAPEAHYGGRIDARTDIFSLGTVFYELLTAKNPFAAPTYEGVLQRVMNTVPAPVSEVNRTIGPALAAVIARMMAKDPAERYASCEVVMGGLTESRRLGEASAPAQLAAPVAAERARRSVLWPVAAAVLVAIGAAWAVWRAQVASALPPERNLAVLTPRTPGASEDASSFALGATALLASRLRKHQDRAGFQLAPFSESVSEKLASAAEARKIQGVNLALVPTFEPRTDAFRVRLELWDATHARRIATRTVEAPVSQPFAFLDRVSRDAHHMLRLPERGGDLASESGVRGAGTLRYLLQGIGRYEIAATAEQARRALDDLELACNTEPEAAAPRAWLCFAQIRCYALDGDRGWIERALASARAAVDRDSASALSYSALGNALASGNEPAGSLAAYRRAGELDPTDDWAALRAARTYTQLGQPEKEKESYLATIAARPHCWQPYWWLATWYYRRGQTAEAIGAYREMIRHAPDLYRGYAALGGILVLQGAYDRAIDTLKISIDLRPNSIAFDNLGTAYFNSGRLEQAVDAYNQSFQFGFASYQSWLNLGDAYYWLRGRRGQAANAYAQAVKMGREEGAKGGHSGRTFDVMIPANLSTVFPKIGQPDSARVYLQRALRADSTNANVQFCAALTLWQLGDRGRAMAWLGKAVQNGYPVPWIRDSPVFEEWRGEEAFRALIAGAGPPTQQSAASGKGGRT